MTGIHLGIDLSGSTAGLLHCPKCIPSRNTYFSPFALPSLCPRSAFPGNAELIGTPWPWQHPWTPKNRYNSSAQSRSPQQCPTHSSLPEMPLEHSRSQLRHILGLHHIPAHLQYMEEVQLAQSVGSSPRAAGQAGSQHCCTETHISILFVQKPCCRQENPAP